MRRRERGGGVLGSREWCDYAEGLRARWTGVVTGQKDSGRRQEVGVRVEGVGVGQRPSLRLMERQNKAVRRM